MEYHVLGVQVNIEDTFRSISFDQIKHVVKDKLQEYLTLGRHLLGDNSTDEQCLRAAVENIKDFIVVQSCEYMLKRDNWIRVFSGTPIGKSECDCDVDKLVVLGVAVQDILVGLDMDRNRFAPWLMDHLAVYGIIIDPSSVKYYHLSTYI